MTGPHWQERPIVFECEGDRLIGIAALPDQPADTGVLIIVGGPQYRAGSHRQFTLLARHLAGENIASLRFDYRGMGDSEGERRDFEQIHADIRAAVDALLAQAPSLRDIVLWGLCDAASAALFYGYTDARVCGMVLLNPWVHSEVGEARIKLKHYYLARLCQRSFWLNLLSGGINPLTALTDLAGMARRALSKKSENPQSTTPEPMDFVERMRIGLQKYPGNILLILSQNDFTAQEFQALGGPWQTLLEHPRIRRHSLADANHTFASADWRQEVSTLTAQWIIDAGNI